MGEMRNTFGYLVGKLEGKRPLGREGRSGRIILKCIVREEDMRCGRDSTGWPRTGTSAGLL
jgi:hypothetical protein